ncbi:hypothetical protein GCM10009804_68840 [Kribbella hippodromi]|uniref:Uncharacterized protein n=1 Tax=Kribbella hippodromi TaxID=434347 RepID=A0ABN2ED90_9ACTN
MARVPPAQTSSSPARQQSPGNPEPPARQEFPRTGVAPAAYASTRLARGQLPLLRTANSHSRVFRGLSPCRSAPHRARRRLLPTHAPAQHRYIPSVPAPARSGAAAGAAGLRRGARLSPDVRLTPGCTCCARSSRRRS